MNKGEHCNKVVLAGNDGCRVVYCETHMVTEVEIGAISLRLDIEAFSTLNDLLNDASKKLTLLHQAKSVSGDLMNRLRNAG